ncbi:MAG: phosphoglucosamine mutase [Bacteroidetes bacterium GWE2_41_25]|nr:MAG: phosphoglucosamine mutase [Bacteroidetes bacterium GWA2_40_15]OFX98334.1 MAG: phosphoglucosamine mutase [Bacteroidetes bacterium GWE2_41_25]OFY00697.1 MAG: phosphoglucosamine mutase [Bacteroidetes bacterium GWC2_40_22]OFY59265.1 MAG: phosphoglucosamine mutase [Bacteroidetes bacterium GWF2_41_9]HAM10806.1 phosphoglucosamine mutase [Bacteroidales bacterium]
MALIKSISGIRGTIGGKPGECFTPVDIVKFTAAYGIWLQRRHKKEKLKVVVGRDGRKSGGIVNSLVVTSLRSLGINVTDLGMATTPTVEVAVTGTGSDGGIIITASHNPAEWNALKLLTEAGEFLSADQGNEVLDIADREDFIFSPVDSIGTLDFDDSWGQKHIDMILKLKLVNVHAIKSARFSIAIDCINSVGGIIVPQLLDALGVKKIFELNTIPDGNFAHNPEPLPANLKDISALVVKEKADIGLVVDPDVDRLAIVCEDGSMFGEEYTLVAVTDYILGNTPGSTVSNLSSSRALRDISEKHYCKHYSTPVGEVNVVEEMKRREAVIGGEGNGGVIYPELHYGRDALGGIALFLSHLAISKTKCSDLRQGYPDYVMAKRKIALDPSLEFSHILSAIKNNFPGHLTDERDGLWIETTTGWVQVRKSNTEPVMRIYAEGRTIHEADGLADRVIEIVKNI